MMRFCIILGAMKAGTTSLFNYLAQHPEIAPCNKKEPNFFSHHYAKKGFNWYLSFWKGQAIDNKVLLEASTNYTKYPAFPESSSNMKDFCRKHNVSLKLIYIMRNPFERITSHYTYAFARWIKEPLEERIKHGHILHVSRYAQQLNRYYDKFDHKDILLLDFDDLIRKPDKLLKQICEFINISTRFQFSNLHEIHNKSTDTVITRPIDKLYKDYPFVKSCSKIFPKGFKRYIASLLFRKKIQKNFKLTEIQRKLVHEALKDDMVCLQEKYGINVKKWGF